MTTPAVTIGVLHPGEMGAAVAAEARRRGARVLWYPTGRSQATEVKYPKHVLPGTFASGFEMDLMLKDLAIAARLAADAEQSTPITGKAVETLSEAREHLGAAGLDHTEIVRYYEAVNHAHIRTSEERPHP